MDLYKLGDFRGTLFSNKHIDVIGLTDALVVLRTSDQTILMPTLEEGTMKLWEYNIESWAMATNLEHVWNMLKHCDVFKNSKPFPHSRPWASPTWGWLTSNDIPDLDLSSFPTGSPNRVPQPGPAGCSRWYTQRETCSRNACWNDRTTGRCHCSDPRLWPRWCDLEEICLKKWWSSSVGMMTFPIYYSSTFEILPLINSKEKS